MSAKLFSYRVDSVRGKTVVTTVFLSGVSRLARYATRCWRRPGLGLQPRPSSLVLGADGLPVTVQVASCAVGLILPRSSGLGPTSSTSTGSPFPARRPTEMGDRPVRCPVADPGSPTGPGAAVICGHGSNFCINMSASRDDKPSHRQFHSIELTI